ncbi:MAG: bifunctional DNA primase/polymerase [Pseudomonadota bacterium]|nr:bifunctional DNA primase/polymerase [Pseudomonadota bacterium]
MPGSVLDYAIKYARLGWAVVPLWGISNGRCQCGKADCPSAGKHPHSQLAPRGVHDASREESRIRDWFNRAPDANIGIATGEPSGFIAVDVDPRNGGDTTLEQLQEINGRLPDTAMAITGGGGSHYLLRFAGERVRSPGKGIDIKSTGGLIVVEPSRHISGEGYTWEGSSDPLDGQAIAPIPSWMVEPAPRIGAGPSISGGGYLSPQRLADLHDALLHIPADDYHVWIQVGQALHSTEAPEAFNLWDTWSRNSDKYKPGQCLLKWGSFRAGGGVHVESIFTWAQDRGWQNPARVVAVPVEQAAPLPKLPQLDNVPSELLALPGVLGDIVRLANETAPQPQPQFAVQAALALGATVLGRHVRTTRNNWPSMYFVNVGKSSSGKEHARTIIQHALSAANLGHLIGPEGYSSASSVVSALLHQPSHVALIDELGALLGSANSEGNFHRREAVTSLISAWGQLGGEMRPRAYSTLSAGAQARKEMAALVVKHPALSLLGMTTPKTFYGSLGESAIEGGFLNRFIVVESHLPRQVAQPAGEITIPGSFVEWCSAARAGVGNGNLSGVELGADMPPLPRVVSFDAGAESSFAAYAADCVAAMEALEDEGLAELEGRSNEKALRLSLILAMSEDPMGPIIRQRHADWAIAYVRHYTQQMIEAVRRNMHGTKFAEWRQVVLDCIMAGGERGKTEREIARHCRLFAGLEPRQRRSILDSLAQDGLTQLVEFPTTRGKKRQAWRPMEWEVDDEME